MGLAAAWHASKAGHSVVVLEADRVPGGMAAHFDFRGLSIERFYHFICKPDQATFDLMAELGIADRLRWRGTSMGYFIDGKLYRWGDPLALLSFPLLGPIDKVRYARHVYMASKRKDWSDIEHCNVREWIVAQTGERIWNLLWKRSFELKFYELTDSVSAPWLGARIKRLAASRRSIFQEELGYIDGGTEVLVDALVKGIEANGGRVLCREPASEVEVRDGRVASVVTPGGRHEADHVISTMAIPYVTKLIPALPQDHRAKLEAIRNIGVVCVVLKLKKSVTPHFWVNFNDARIGVPGIVEYSNLRPTREHIVYVPFYMPQGNPKFSREDPAFVDEAKTVVKVVNAGILDDDFVDSAVGRLRYAQPVCEPGFASKLPPIQTPITGLQIADTSFYYPEDRGVSESVRVAKQMAARIDAGPDHADSPSA
jgi:protoporphyrinogen oxidase